MKIRVEKFLALKPAMGYGPPLILEIVDWTSTSCSPTTSGIH
jgi:hypothetical protein